MNCQFCEDYEWSKKHRPKTGRELYTKYYVCLYERTLRKGCGLASTYTHKRRPLNFCPECGRQLKKTKRRMKRERSHSGPMPEVWRENYLFGILPERTGLHNPKRRKSSETLCIQKRRTKRERSGL